MKAKLLKASLDLIKVRVMNNGKHLEKIYLQLLL